MPKLWPVLSQAFTAVFTRLGIQAVPAGPQWFLSDTIVPVSLVDSDITLDAVVGVRAQTPVSAGVQVAQAAGTILADTGALAAGTFQFRLLLSVVDGVNDNELQVQHRDAANAANVSEHEIMHTAAVASQNFTYDLTLTLLANERFRVVQRGAAGAGSRYQASIYQVSV